MFNAFDDLTKANNDNMDAAMKSLDVISKSMQAIAAGAADYSKKSLEQGADAFEKMLGATSFETAMEVQSVYFKTAYESFIAESNRMSEVCADLAKEVYKPLEAYFGKFPAMPYVPAASS
jgi:hypothetical protein